jgi:hypothetical protein
MKMIGDAMVDGVHNIIVGDFNFVTSDTDRISKTDVSCDGNSADKRNANTWHTFAETHAIKVFFQDDYTCENSFRWSRIDRGYTNLHVADVCAMRCACSLLDHPRHLSDHKPLSIVIAASQGKKKKGGIPRWVTAHEEFNAELDAEIRTRCDDFVRCNRRDPSPFDKLRIFKESTYATARYIRRKCTEEVANSTEHKLAIHMGFIKAIYASNFKRAKDLQQKCGGLEHVIVSKDAQVTEEFQRVKDRAVELMQIDVRERAEELRQIRANMPDDAYESKKKGIADSLRRMMPGGTAEVAALKSSSGVIVTKAEDIARVLNEYWQEVFASKPTNSPLRRTWLERIRGKFKVGKQRLTPTREIVEQAIRDTVPSASGPDGIPFDVYKMMGPIAVELFLEVANAMLDQTECPDDDFNLAYMVFIAKGAEGVNEEGVSFCSPGGTRPISIVDCANRILASIFRAALEKEIGHLMNPAQKGFLKGRQMIRNVLEIDMAAQKISVRSRSGAILLFDFAAAFPSISHDMMWEVLGMAGIDENFIAVIKMFYQSNRHLLKLRGSIFRGVEVHSGVRQGCPLSGLLFALCIDVLLDRIDDLLHGDEAIGAFADDIAVVVENFWITAPAMEVLFTEFRSISALSLNVKKTVMVPLWPYSDAVNVASLIKEFCPRWADFVIDGKAKYLGFLLGPKAGEDAWNKPLAKFESRVKHWAGMHLGIAMNAVVFNVYIVPVLEFVAQLLPVTDQVRSMVSWAMRRLAPGPGNWVLQKDLENLTFFGFKIEFRTIESTARAAKLRMLTDVASDATQRQEDIERVQADFFNRPFGAWHTMPLFKVLRDNKAEMERSGVTVKGVRKVMKQDRNPKKEQPFQKAARLAIKSRFEPFDAEERLRNKIKRWRLDGPPAHVTQRILRNMKVVGRTCRPCVTAMLFRTLWNGWPTTARMRHMPGADDMKSCVLGCVGSAEDRIEHYIVCPKAWNVLSNPLPRGLGLHVQWRTKQAMLVAERGLEDYEKTRIAIAVYAVARTVQCMRANPTLQSPESILRMYIREGLRGSSVRGGGCA